MKNEKKDNSTPLPASVYDAQIRKTIPYYDRFHEETINLIKAMSISPKVWLDTGCGTGSLIEKAIKAFPKTRFILADPSNAMLCEAKKKLDTPAGQFSCLPPCGTADVCIPEGNRPDVITAIQSHHYMTKEERAMATKKCYDLLVKGGIYVCFENIRPLMEQGIKIGKEYWKDFQVASGKTPDEAEKHVARFDVEYFPITVEEHLALLRGTGFEVIEIFWYSYMQAGFYAIK